MVRPARVRRGSSAPPPRSPPMFWTLAPNAIRSNTAIATPTSPAQASAVVPARVSRTYLTEVPNANRLVRNTRRQAQQVRGAHQRPRRVARGRAEPPGEPPRPQGQGARRDGAAVGKVLIPALDRQMANGSDAGGVRKD